MKLKQLLGIDLEDYEILAAIKQAQDQGSLEVKIGEAVIKIPQLPQSKSASVAYQIVKE